MTERVVKDNFGNEVEIIKAFEVGEPVYTRFTKYSQAYRNLRAGEACVCPTPEDGNLKNYAIVIHGWARRKGCYIRTKLVDGKLFAERVR